MVNAMDKLNFSLDTFEGPLDLLYHLIEKNKIDIYDIPIAKITDQYLEFINIENNKNLENMSSFIVMAATLITIKTKMLLPISKDKEEEVDPREDLVNKLIEYKKFKEVTNVFKQKYENAKRSIYKKGEHIEIDEDVSLDEIFEGITLENIFNAFQEVMKRKELKVDKVRGSFNSVERDLFTIDDKINYIKDLLIIKNGITFNHIFRDNSSKIEVVVTFLALLELIKTKSVIIKQHMLFDDIVIFRAGEQSEIKRT